MPQALPNAQLLDKRVLAQHLRDLTADPSLALRADELNALAHDLEQDTRLSQWAEVDLVQVFVRPESLAAAPAVSGRPPGLMSRSAGFLRSRPWLRLRGGSAAAIRRRLRERPARDGLLEAALGVLVFVPLLVTWFGLREAVRAYGELSTDDPKEATRPFLQLWQTGFGGHLSSLGRFDNVALATVVLICLLVLLSIWHARARTRAEREESARSIEQEHLLGRLASVLTRAQTALAPHRNASPQQFTAELTKAARRLESLAARAERNHKSLADAANTVGKATDALQAAARTLTGEVPKLGLAADRIDASVRAGQTAASQAGADTIAAARGVADRIKAAGDTVETALATLATAQQTLAARSQSVAEATERASQALQDSTGRTSEAVEGMREATERWDAAAAHWQDAAARLDSGIRELTRTRSPYEADTGTWGGVNGTFGHLPPPVGSQDPPRDGGEP